MQWPTPDDLSPAAQQGLRAAHLLLLPDSVGSDAVDTLVGQRVDDSRLLDAGRARLGRRSAISGPFYLDDDAAVVAQVPRPWSLVYSLEAPVERDVAAFADINDPVQRAWWMRMFPSGKPFREEGDAIELAFALARRLDGAVRVAGSAVVVQPDPRRLVDLVVWSPYWLEPGRLLDLLTPVLPGASIDIGGQPWTGPGPVDPEPWSLDPLDLASLDVVHALDDERRTAAAVVGAANDARVLARPDVVDGFEVRADDSLRVGQMHEDLVPAWVRSRIADHLPRPYDPVVTFSLGWQPDDPAQLEAEQPHYLFRLQRERIRPRLRVAARVIAEVTSGVVTDADGFEVDRLTL